MFSISTPANTTTINDFAADTAFASLAFTGGDYTVSGRSIRLGDDGITASAGTVTLDTAFTIDPIDVPIVVAAGSRVISSGVLGGVGGIHKDGTGLLILSGANTYAGVTHIAEGTLSVRSATALGSAAAGTELTDGTLELAGGVTIQGESLSILPYIEQENVIRSVGGANAWTGAWNLDPICSPVVVAAGSSLTASGVLSGGGGLHKDGLGTLVLSGVNTYRGVTHVEQGVLSARSNAALGSAAAGTELMGGTLELAGGVAVRGESLSLLPYIEQDSIIRSVAGANAWTGAWTIDPIDVPIVVETGSQFTASGVLGGTGGIRKDGPGTLVLSGANTYAGITHVAEGTLRITDEKALGSTAGITRLIGGTTLESLGDLTLKETLEAVGDPPGTQSPAVTIRNLGGLLKIDGGLYVNPLLRFEIPSGTIILTPEIAGNDDVEVAGPGTLILTVDNDELNGKITLWSGTLLINGSWAGVPVVVQGGVLGGTGVTGPITLNGGAIQGAVLQASPMVPGQIDLVVGGTADADDIRITPSSGGRTGVDLNGSSLGSYTPTGRIIVYAGPGDDGIQVAGGITRPAWLYGDAGNDRLRAVPATTC